MSGKIRAIRWKRMRIPLIYDWMKEAKPTEEEEREVMRRYAQARADIEALKEKFIEGNLSREERKRLSSSRCASRHQNWKMIPGQTWQCFWISAEDPDKRIQAKQATRSVCRKQSVPFPRLRLVSSHAETSLVITRMDHARTGGYACRRRRTR